ncbi:MAG: hypothetical protein P8099_14610 [Gemmatimonadota bacterium]
MRIATPFCLVLLSATPLTLNAQGVGLFARVGTGGAGGGVAYGVTRTLNVRAEASYFSYSVSDVALDVDYDAGVNADGTLLLGSLLADWHPGGHAFRFTVGAVYNGSSASGTIVPREPIQVGSRSYQPTELGSVTGDPLPACSPPPRRKRSRSRRTSGGCSGTPLRLSACRSA